MYTYKLWDKKSPINGISAEDMLRNHNITESSVGLVLDEDGTVVNFQYNNGMPYNEDEALEDVRRIAIEGNNPTEPLEDESEKLKNTVQAQGLIILKMLGLEADIPDEEQEKLILSAFHGLNFDKVNLLQSLNIKKKV